MVDSKYNYTIKSIIAQLNALEVDGETMQHILKETGMDAQMLRQLIMTAPIGHVDALVEERYELEDCCNHSWVVRGEDENEEECCGCNLRRSVY